MKKKILFIISIAVIAFTGCEKFNDYWPGHDIPSHSNSDAAVAIDWYKLECRILLERNSAMNGVHFGYLGIALYEAVRYDKSNTVSLSSLLDKMPEMPAPSRESYDWVLSGNAAMASMLRNMNSGLTPANLASIDSLENAYNQKSTAPASSDKYARSRAFGQSIANAVYQWYLTDNFNPSNLGYIPPVFLGAWVPTLPAFANGVMPYIGGARTFLASNTSFAYPDAPFPYSENRKSDYYKMVKKVYTVNKNLTTEQKNIALYYIDQGNGLGYTPAGHDMSVVAQLVAAKKVGLVTAAETFAKAGITERDATIVCFKKKYEINQMRPITYIRHLIDTGWLPFIVTPPHPEYPAAHALITGSVMETVAKVLGNQIQFSDHSYDFRGWAPRSFSSITAIGSETGISRLYGGIHYEESIDIGLTMAKVIGGKTGNLNLQR